MIRYLIDSSALWRLLRDDELYVRWEDALDLGTVGSCEPQRIEFRQSARSIAEFDQMSDTFALVYPDVPVPKSAWRWVDAAQYRLLRDGKHRALSVVDLLICAVAAHHGLTVVHDDLDFVTAAGSLTDVRERNVSTFG